MRQRIGTDKIDIFERVADTGRIGHIREPRFSKFPRVQIISLD